uniref:Uncharacterized protein n=1 Tax=Meloidogyne incognita TaxID=6306 RepID=A0A914MBN7_MELIC
MDPAAINREEPAAITTPIEVWVSKMRQFFILCQYLEYFRIVKEINSTTYHPIFYISIG